MLRSFVGARIYDISAGNEADLDQIPDANVPTVLLRMAALFGNMFLLDLQRCHDFAGVAGTVLHGTCVIASSCIQPACRCVAVLLRRELGGHFADIAVHAHPQTANAPRLHRGLLYGRSGVR